MPKFKRNHVTIHYHEQGTGESIIFIHPPLLTLENFHYSVAKLSEYYHVVAFDIRGHGLSDRSEEPLTYPLIVQDILHLMDHLKIEKAYLCGYSTGGSIALEAMLSNPDRFKGGILVSAMSEVSDWWLKARIALAVSLTFVKAKPLISWSICGGNANNYTTFSQLNHAANKGTTASWKQYYTYSLSYNCTERLKQIQAPVLLMYGAKDKGFIRYADILHRQLPNNELHWIDQAKHQIPTKNDEAMNQLIHHWIGSLKEPQSL